MLSLILPTYNEAENIPTLIEILEGVLTSIDHEIIVVDDDSPDRTWSVAQKLAATVPALRILRRCGRRGLSSAVVEGFDAARGDILAVMDADGQHDPSLLIALIQAIQRGADVAIGSRYVPGGSVGAWVRDRRIVSRTGTHLALAACRIRVSDPLGGFFALRASLYRAVRGHIRPSGFKILLEILAALPPTVRIAEIPLTFRMRLHGRSKLSLRVECQFMLQIVRLLLRKLTIPRFLPVAFWLIAAILFLTLLPRAWALRSLAVNPALRSTVAAALTNVAKEEGWRISDMTLLSVSRDVVALRYQEHLRSPEPASRCTIAFTPHFLLTCTAGN